ncbi:MAG: FHA domain-containing protein [Gammaproteobacteria bacterium]|nr:FHA domain-containing protein [Gammaproteobacteria bacterium]
MSGYFLINGDLRFELEGETLIGRSDDCDLKVEDGHPSRRHATLTINAEGAWLEDLGSANGTYVNEQRITARTKLKSGDRISFDTAGYEFEAPASAADLGEATVVRSIPVDDGATVVRPIPPTAESAPVKNEAATPEPAPATPAAPPAGDSVPRSWADPEYQNDQSTRMFTAEELKAMTAGSGEAGSTTDSGIAGAHLQVTKGANTGEVLMFGDDKNEWTVGTDADRDLVVSDSGVSAYHAKITREGQRWKVIDQMSANGTFVNEHKGTVSFLSSGDRIRFGPVECKVAFPTAARTTSGPGKAQKSKKSGRNVWVIAALAAAGTVGLLVVALQFI